MRRGVWTFALAASGCEAPVVEAEPEDEVVVGEHVDLHIDPGLEMCGDLVAHMDAYTAALAEAVAVDLTGLRFPYHWDAEEGFLRGPCPEAIGCALRTKVHARVAPLDHELAHSVSFEIGYPSSFFIEGFAVAFETQESLAHGVLELPGQASLAEAIDSTALGKLAAEHYPLAGAFTRFLIDRHGMAEYLRFYAALSGVLNYEGVDEDYQRVFGEPLAGAIATFDAERRACPAGVSGFKLLECSAPALAWDGDELEVRRSLRCGDPGVIGTFLDKTARVMTSFEVEEPGSFAINFAAEASGSVATLASCVGCDGDWVAAAFVADEGPRELFLPAGRYSLQLAGPAGERTALALRLQRISSGP